jgi:hypothetical protein
MSISLQEARRKLDILEKLAFDPKLILTDLFTDGVSGSNFLYQVKVNNKYILDYLREYLSELPVFSGCKVTNSAGVFIVNLESLKLDFGWRSSYISDDKIIKIDADLRTFKVIDKDIEKYEMVLNKEYTIEVKELSDFWKRFENLTVKKRVINALNSFKTQKKLLVKILDFKFWLFCSNKKIEEALTRESKKIDDTNKYNNEQYKEDIALQEYYMKYAPDHIQKIKSKQQEIINYLLSIGYKEDVEMSIY